MTTSTVSTKSYEATFILDTRGSEQPIEAHVERLQAAIAAIGGTDITSENLGRRDFVRVTDRNHPADYFLRFRFTGPLHVAVSLREKLQLDKTLKRLLVEVV